MRGRESEARKEEEPIWGCIIELAVINCNWFLKYSSPRSHIYCVWGELVGGVVMGENLFIFSSSSSGQSFSTQTWTTPHFWIVSMWVLSEVPWHPVKLVSTGKPLGDSQMTCDIVMREKVLLRLHLYEVCAHTELASSSHIWNTRWARLTPSEIEHKKYLLQSIHCTTVSLLIFSVVSSFHAIIQYGASICVCVCVYVHVCVWKRERHTHRERQMRERERICPHFLSDSRGVSPIHKRFSFKI